MHIMEREWCKSYNVYMLWRENGAIHVMEREWCAKALVYEYYRERNGARALVFD